MELYYRDLISEEASLEKLVDDLSLVVQGANNLAEAAGADFQRDQYGEISSRLARLQENCRRLRHQMVAGAQATDRLVRQHPYSAAGAAFGLGLLLGLVLKRRR